MLRALLLPVLLAIAFAAFPQSQKAPGNRAVRLNGKTDFIHFGDRYRDVKLPYTISAWANLDTTNFWYAPIFTNRNCVHVYTGFRLIIDRNMISLEYGDGFGSSHPAYRSGKFANVKLSPGEWHHITAVVIDAQHIDLYLDGKNVGGELNGESAYPMDSDKDGFTSSGYFISNNVEYWYKGMIDDIRFWNRALTPKEVADNMCRPLTGQEPGLIGYWDFEDGSGSTVLDKSNNKYHGKMTGKAARVRANLPCADTAANEKQPPRPADVTKSGDK